jgi:hypothetical protein
MSIFVASSGTTLSEELEGLKWTYPAFVDGLVSEARELECKLLGEDERGSLSALNELYSATVVFLRARPRQLRSPRLLIG